MSHTYFYKNIRAKTLIYLVKNGKKVDKKNCIAGEGHHPSKYTYISYLYLYIGGMHTLIQVQLGMRVRGSEHFTCQRVHKA